MRMTEEHIRDLNEAIHSEREIAEPEPIVSIQHYHLYFRLTT